MANLWIKRKEKLFLYIEFLPVFNFKNSVKNIIEEDFLPCGVHGLAFVTHAVIAKRSDLGRHRSVGMRIMAEYVSYVW